MTKIDSNNKNSLITIPLRRKDHTTSELSINSAPNYKEAPVIFSSRLKHLSAQEEQFYREAYYKKAPDIKTMQPLKTPHYTFNHTHEYAISDATLWYRRQGSTDFHPLYFDGFAEVQPIFIDCDGANLIVIDDKQQLHYKKVLKEYRHDEIIHKFKKIKKDRSIIDKRSYIAVDISKKNNWFDSWFSLPFISYIVNFFTTNRLTIDKDALSVAISHRGRYNDYVEDKILGRHFTDQGVTTLYVLDKNGQDIHKFDPWAPSFAKVTIGLKETKSASFMANAISVSASTIMAIGFETNWQTGKKTLKVLTRLADIDTEGGNPAIKYSFVPEHAHKDTRVLPIDCDWHEHPLILQKKAFATSSITIMQTGEGNDARELRILGGDEEEKIGYYTKSLKDNEFKFIPISETIVVPEAIKPIVSEAEGSSVNDYQGFFKGHKIQLSNFGLRSNHAELSIVIDNKTYKFDIYKRLSLASFLGLDKFKYDMVINSDDEYIKELFGFHKTMGIKIEQKDNDLSIRSHKLATHHFKMDLCS